MKTFKTFKKLFEEMTAELRQNPEMLAEHELAQAEFGQETLIGCYRCKCAVFGEYEITLDARIVEKTAAVLATLTPREAKVLRMRFGIGFSAHSLEEIARKLEITPERVRQIEAKALRKMRHWKRRVIWQVVAAINHQEELQKIFDAQIVSITELSRECIRCSENVSSQNSDADDSNLCDWCGHVVAKNRDEAV